MTPRRIDVIFRGAKGDKGDQGDQGEKGQRGMPPGQRRAVVYLFALCVALIIVLGVALFRLEHDSQAAQRRQGEAVEAKLCQTFGALAALKPPTGNASANPSRAYEQDQHAILSQIGADLGCNSGRH